MLKQSMAFGNATFGGFDTMEEMLRAVAGLNDELRDICGIELHVSAHLWHELMVDPRTPKIGHMAPYNNPRAISLIKWMAGVDKREFAPIGRIIPPGFGFPWSDAGAFTNPDEEIRHLAHDAMVHAFKVSSRVQACDAGLGKVIFWDGPDGFSWRRLTEGNDIHLGYGLNETYDEWEMLVKGVGEAAQEAASYGYGKDGSLLFESKPGGDPCWIGICTDTFLEIEAVNAINKIIGQNYCVWQGEFCHTRGSGETFASAMHKVIAGGVFAGQIHLNSGPISPAKFSELLDAPGGTLLSEFPPYVDPDFLPGQGVEEWVSDQQESLAVGAEWSKETGEVFEIEFDARFAREPDTIGALRQSVLWTVAEMKEHDAVPARW